MLDVGGGLGNFAREFARRGADVTLFDQSEVIEIVSPLLESEPIDLVAGDLLDSLPQEFDLAFCSRITHMFSPKENRRLFENCDEALSPDGTVVCTDFVRGRSDRAPIFAVNMLAQTEHGDTYSDGEYCEWLRTAGFEDTAVREIPRTELQAIVGHKR